MTNLWFWSASKKKTIAENFLKNTLFIIQTKGRNIDIDLEDISQSDEKEVLFLPYSKFLIKSKEKKIFKNKEIFEIKIEDLYDKDERKNIEKFNINSEEFYLALYFSDNTWFIYSSIYYFILFIICYNNLFIKLNLFREFGIKLFKN